MTRFHSAALLIFRLFVSWDVSVLRSIAYGLEILFISSKMDDFFSPMIGLKFLMALGITENKDTFLKTSVFNRFSTVSAVVQKYDADVGRENVLLGNDVIIKCNIPSFVSDFVSIVAWIDSEGSSHTAEQNLMGNLYN